MLVAFEGLARGLNNALPPLLVGLRAKWPRVGVCLLIPGGSSGRLSARHAGQVLRGLRPVELVDIERRRIALELLGDVRRIDGQLEALTKHIGIAVVASGTTVTDVYGIGPIRAALIVGPTGDVTRFPSAGHYARHNTTAPLEASSGPRVRHRLNPRGNRQLNHALHVAAITQVSHDTTGRAYFLRKIAEGKTRKEALRALKRRISDAVYHQLVNDTRP